MDVFGVMALITGELRSATVVARENCSFVTLSRNSLESVLLAHPSVCLAILRDAYGKLRAINLRLQRLDQPQKTTGR